MIILERRTSYFPPHRHVGKAQSCHIMRGRAAVFVFEEDGRVERCVVLGGDKTIIRIGENRYHFTLPLSEFVIYHEGKLGPFLPEGDSIFAEWAPGRSVSMTEEIENYLSELQRHIIQR
jgi:cupin fold WbuC family metalloprotein